MIISTFQCIDDAPLESSCKDCGTKCSRKWTAIRGAIDITATGHTMMKILIGIYYCMRCCRYFRSQPHNFLPRNIFSNQAINIAVASVIEDGMPIIKVSHRMQRDFGLKISEGAIRSWVAKAAKEFRTQENHKPFEPVVLQESSGVLCIDEAYSGRLGILLAIDPNNSDLLVGYLIAEKSFDSATVANFLKSLKEKGIEPHQVITDESSLYPAAIHEDWPLAAHQLCLFHLSQKISNLSKKAVRTLIKSLPKPPKSKTERATKDHPEKVLLVLKMWRNGRKIREIARMVGVSRNTAKKWVSEPDLIRTRYGVEPEKVVCLDTEIKTNHRKGPIIPCPKGWTSWNQLSEVRRALSKLAYGVSSKGENKNFSENYKIIIETPVQNQIDEIRQFAIKWREIWPDSTGPKDIEIAKKAWDKLASLPLNQATKGFATFQGRMTENLFKSLSTFFENEDFKGTKNSAENYARRIKKIQKARYRIRSAHHLEDQILLDALTQKQRTVKKKEAIATN